MSVVLDYTGGVFAAKPTGGSLGTDPASIGDANFGDVSLLLHGDGTSGSTTITDSSSNSTSVTVVGNTQIDTAVKKFGTGSIEFDGTGDELTYTAPALSGDFTFEAWIYPESQVQTFPICFAPVSDTTVANRVALSYDTSTYVDKFSCRVGSNFIVASSTSSTGQWYHVAIVRSGSTVSMYIDGVSQGTQTFSTSVSSRTAYIGGSSLISSNTHFAGFIDDFRLTNGVARYTSNFTAPTAAFSNTGPTLDLSTGNTFVHAPSANVAYAFSNPPASGTAIDFTLKVTGAGAYDIANASYDSVSFSVAAKETIPAGLSFKSDGTKMYVCGNNSDAVHEYNLTAWDISTASFNQSFSLTQAGTHSADLFFKPDGLSFFIAEQNNADIDEYTMTSAWDISTASFNQSFSVSSQETSPRGVFFKPDGTKMYVCGNTGDDVNEYSLTAWDISTASYVQNVSVSAKDTIPQGVVFNSSGTSFFIAGNSSDSIHEFSMTSAWDVSTASFANTLSVSGQDTAPTAIFFKPDGTKLFVSGGANDTVFQYSTVAATTSTITWPSSVKWAGGTAPSAPASGETDAFTFYSTDSGTSYYGFQAGDAYS